MSSQNDIFKLSTRCPELQFLLCCSHSELNKKQLILAKEIIEKKINWDLFTKLTLNHGMAPLVSRNVIKHFSKTVPEENKAVLRNFMIASTQSNLSLLKELINIFKLLTQNNIQCIPFKGLIVAQHIYGDFSMRKCGDIDILVKYDDFIKAKSIFLSQGFQQTLDEQDEFDYLQMGLFHDSRKINIDLHYGIPPKEVGIKASKLFTNVSYISIGNNNINTLSSIDMFLVLCINATKEYWNQSVYRYCDIHEFLKNNAIDWDLLLKRANALKCKRMLYTALLVCRDLFAIPEEPDIVNKINSIPELKKIRNELMQQLLPTDTMNYKNERKRFFYLASETEFFTCLMDTKWVKMKFNYPKLLTINQRDLAFIQLPYKYFFLYFLIKPFRVLIKKSRELFTGATSSRLK